MSLHLITQRGQPYNSMRLCCEYCGRSVYDINGGFGEAWTDELKQFLDSPLACRLIKKDEVT